MDRLMESFLFMLLGVFLGWMPGIFRWLWDKKTSTGMQGITFRIGELMRPGNATYKCKLPIEITNKRQGPVRLSNAIFRFNPESSMLSDPKWPAEHKSSWYHLEFYNTHTKNHDLPDLYLRKGETSNLWIGIDPSRPDKQIHEALGRKRKVGTILLQLTYWDQRGKPTFHQIRFSV